MNLSAIKSRGGFFAAVFLTIATAALGVPASAQPINYVALGDSYAAGVGELGVPFTWPSSTSCSRSHEGYVQRLGRALGAVWYFEACGGAKAVDRGMFGIPEELFTVIQSVRDDQLARLNSGTDLVTLTVGGNDVSFLSLVLKCVLTAYPLSHLGCQNQINESKSRIANELPAKLNLLYPTIRGRAPNAVVVVTGYPRPFQHNGPLICPNAYYLSRDLRNQLNTAVDQLNYRIAAAAHANGFHFADPNPYFSGHGVCSNDPYFRHRLDFLPNIGNVAHPNAKGYEQGYMPALRALLLP